MSIAKKKKPGAVRGIIIRKAGAPGRADLEAGVAESKQVDPFAAVYQEIVPPRMSPEALATITASSPEVPQCVTAMSVNIPGFGYRFVREYSDEIVAGLPGADGLATEIEAERRRLVNRFSTLAGDISFTRLRRETREDLETTGNAYWEILRGARGQIVEIVRMPSTRVRATREDDEYVAVTSKLKQVDDRGIPYIEERPRKRRFRRYVQGRYGRQANRWFKAYGDPRVLDVETGKFASEADQTNWQGTGAPMPETRKANEVMHFKIPSLLDSVYGQPRWVNGMADVLGAREGQEVNLNTLRNNNIPSMFILVSGGRMTQASLKRLTQMAENVAQPGQNFSNFCILEGEPLDDSSDESGNVKIDIKPMTKDQITDAMFTKYIDIATDTTRRNFRLPGVLVGRTKDLTKSATAEARKLADEQVFAPEREEDDWHINATLLMEMGAVWHLFKSKTPNVTDNNELVQLAAVVERTGGMTPRIARGLITDVFADAANAPPLKEEEFDPDVPFSLTMAKAVKNEAIPTEVNQQVAPVQGPTAPGSGATEVKSLVDEVEAMAALDEILARYSK